MTPTQSATPQGYVLGAGEGERLAHFADAGEIFIGVGPATGSASFALGTQQVRAGGGIPVHRHWEKDEAFYVLGGSGIFSLNDVSHPIEKGATLFIPKNAWHGFTTPEHELLLLWVMANCRLGWLFPRNLQSTRCAAEATDSRSDRRDWPQIWNGIQIACRRLFRDRLHLCDLLQHGLLSIIFDRARRSGLEPDFRYSRPKSSGDATCR
jgi:quercetin dioxygenase-like cupin family protein